MLSFLSTSNELVILVVLTILFVIFFVMFLGYAISWFSKENEVKVDKRASEILIERADIRSREANKFIIDCNKKEQELNERIKNLNELETNLAENEKDLVERENCMDKKYQEMQNKEKFLNNFEKSLNARYELILEQELLQKSAPNMDKKNYKDILYTDYKDFFILSGYGTKKNKEEIKKLGGNWVSSQSFWIFNNSEKELVQNFLNDFIIGI